MTAGRIMLVEDTLGIGRAVGRALTLAQGDNFQVQTCTTAEQAQELLLDGEPFDLLITDLRLPGMSGLELLTWARQRCPQLRSILITAYGSPQVEEQVRDLADAYLPKPFRLNDLIRLARLTLSEPAAKSLPADQEAALAAQQAVEFALLEGAGHRRLHFVALASDLDGTLTHDPAGRVDAATWELLRQLKTSGFTIILVTGRSLETFAAGGPFSELCEAIVAENGAIVYFPRRDAVIFPFGRLPPELLQRLMSADIPLERGMAILSTRVPHDAVILQQLREVGGGATVEYNRGAVMVLPLGATKGTGLKYALNELGLSPHNVVACGDAENDRSLFEAAECAAAVGSAPAGIQGLADIVLPYSDAASVQALVRRLLAGRLPGFRSRLYRQLSVGQNLQGDPLHIDPFVLLNGNLGIFGASSSGKSWLAGLLTEELLRQGYQVCIIDPEGDYRALAAGPHILLLGGPRQALPPVTDVFNFLESGQVSLVLDLSAYGPEQRAAYLMELLPAVQGLRARRGRPHWFLLDEAQNFCLQGGIELVESLQEAMRFGGFGLVSFRLALVDPMLRALVGHCLLTRLSLDEDLEVLSGFLEPLEDGREALAQLPVLPVGQALWAVNSGEPHWPHPPGIVRFQVGPRSVPHIRHLHKYLRAPLPAPKRFYFSDSSGHATGRVAANLWEFREALAELPLDTLSYHLQRGDFEQWVRGVLRDDELARRIHKVVDRGLTGKDLRSALLEVVVVRYDELDNLA